MVEKISPGKLPEGFKFGSSVAPFQVEDNKDGNRKTDWDIFIAKKKGILKLEDSGLDWWGTEQAERDFERMADLGLNAQRMGIEWARIQPEKNAISKEGIARYRSMIDKLKELNIEPMVTLNHFTLPSWIVKEGGWESSDTKKAFKNYAAILADKFGDVPYWLTINEPTTFLSVGYVTGEWPPHKRNSLKGHILSSRNIIKANDLAYDELKKRLPESQIGGTHILTWFEPKNSESRLNRSIAELANRTLNTYYPRHEKSDFIGVDFYTGYELELNKEIKFGVSESRFPEQIPFAKISAPEGSYKANNGWPVTPEYFLKALKYMHKEFKKPIIVAENGIADREDKLRSFYILTHLAALQEAIRQGVDVRGYYHWSTVGNLEWDYGLMYDFGLLGANKGSNERTIRQSAELYGEIARSGEIDIDRLSEKYLTPEQKEKAKKNFHKNAPVLG